MGVNISVDNRDLRRRVDIVEMSSRIAYTYLSDTDFFSVSFTEVKSSNFSLQGKSLASRGFLLSARNIILIIRVINSRSRFLDLKDPAFFVKHTLEGQGPSKKISLFLMLFNI